MTNPKGRFGIHGGQYIPETLMNAVQELEAAYEHYKNDPEFQAWCEQNSEAAVCPGGESGDLATGRALRALEPILARDEDALCVIHGGIICGMLARWFGGTRYDYPCDPGHGYAVCVSGGKPVSCSSL